MDEHLTMADARRRERQGICPHTAFKCMLCGLARDNLFNEYRAKIELLEMVLDHHEELLNRIGVDYTSYKHIIVDDTISILQKHLIADYFSHRGKTDQPSWLSE